MEYRVELTNRAQHDLSYIYLQINAPESLAAARWFSRLESAVYTLEHLPRHCPLAPEGKVAKRTLRHLLYGKKPHVYRIVYEIDEPTKTVYVLTIRHRAMDTAGKDELS